MEGGLATRVYSGGLDKSGVQTGHVSMTMTGGKTLSYYYGGEGISEGDAKITVTGGRMEEVIDFVNTDCPLTIYMDRSVLHNTPSGKLCPAIPDAAKIYWTDASIPKI